MTALIDLGKSYQATIPRSSSFDLVGSMITPSVFVLFSDVSHTILMLVCNDGAYPPTSTPIRRFFEAFIVADQFFDSGNSGLQGEKSSQHCHYTSCMVLRRSDKISLVGQVNPQRTPAPSSLPCLLQLSRPPTTPHSSLLEPRPCISIRLIVNSQIGVASCCDT